MEVIEIGSRKICIKGVGKLFYQDGFPLSISKDILKEKGVELSWLHVADELYKNGWTEKRCLTTLRMEIDDDKTYSMVEKFIKIANGNETKLYSETGYEDQREMLFDYLFGCSSSSVIADKSKITNDIVRIFDYVSSQ